MTLAKIVVSGTVTKNPEKRFTQNNVPITSFVMDIYPQDSTIVRVVALGNLAERLAEQITIGDSVIVDGRPQIETVQSPMGKDKRVIEINANAVEKLGAQAPSAPVQKSAPVSAPQKAENIVQFASDEISDELLDEDEIPF